MKRTASWLCAVAVAIQAPAQAVEATDRAPCARLFAQGRSGLFMAAGGDLVAVSGSARFVKGARLFYVAADAEGHPFRVNRPTAWHVRTQTIGNTGPADQVFVWRGAVTTECSDGKALPTFSELGRFVSLLRYLDHHAKPADARRADEQVRSSFHFVISDPARTMKCTARTDDPQILGGDLQRVYGFDDVTRGNGLFARATQTSRAAASFSPVYSGLSSELAYAAPPEPACFGFTMPVPTRSSLIEQVFPFLRGLGSPTWRPAQTRIVVETIPQRVRQEPTTLSWTY